MTTFVEQTCNFVSQMGLFLIGRCTGTLFVSSTTHQNIPPTLLLFSLCFPSLCVQPFHSSHSAALSLILHPSLPTLHGVCLISLPVHPIARSARQTLLARRGDARPRRPALQPSPEKKEERRGKKNNLVNFLSS